jgi:hypothetical protein
MVISLIDVNTGLSAQAAIGLLISEILQHQRSRNKNATSGPAFTEVVTK